MGKSIWPHGGVATEDKGATLDGSCGRVQKPGCGRKMVGSAGRTGHDGVAQSGRRWSLQTGGVGARIQEFGRPGWALASSTRSWATQQHGPGPYNPFPLI
jgi:hypothetical protein